MTDYLSGRWIHMIATLQGLPQTPLPDLPGRRHVCEDDLLPELTEREAVLLADIPAVEAAAVLGLSRQRIYQLRRDLALKGPAT